LLLHVIGQGAQEEVAADFIGWDRFQW
jgi:hypothetical protein